MQAMDRFSALALVAVLLGGLLPPAAQAQFDAPAAQPKKLVADVMFQGCYNTPVQQLQAMIKTRAGVEFIPEVSQDDVRTLYNTRKFLNIQVVPREESDGRVTVCFLCKEYPTLVEEVEFQGAKHLKKDELEKLTGIRKGVPLNPEANRLACQAIVRKLNEDGRPFATCDLLSGTKPGDKKVVFNITEGSKMNLRAVKFAGNEWGETGRLMAQIQTKPILGLFPTRYHPSAIESDISKIEEYYKNFGFLDVKVSKGLELTEDGRDVIVTYYVSEGVRYTIQNMPHVHTRGAVPVEQLEQLSRIKAGQFYSQADVDQDVNNIKDYEGYTGRMANVQPVPVFNRDMPGVVQVNYEVDERPPCRVGQIFIVGNERTRQNVIMRQLPLYPGQLLTYPDLRMAERNLQRLNIFQTSQDGSVKPTVEVLDKEGPNPYKDILVSVQEDNTGSLVFGVGVNSNSGLTGSIVLNERNFDILRPASSWDDLLSGDAWRGAGQEFRIEAVPGTQLQRYTISWREPYLFETPNSLGLNGYYYTRIYNEYDEQRTGGRVVLGRRLTPQWTVSGAVRVEDVEVNNVVYFAPPEIRDFVGSNFLTGGRVSATFDTRDSYLRPTAGQVIDFGFEECTGSYTFPVATAEYNKYFTLWQRPDGSGRHVLAFHSQVGWAGTNTPVFERFYAGGLRSIRGFQFRGVGPDINGFKVGGDFLFLNSLEYQLPVLANDSFFMVGFIDSGTVEQKVEIGTYRVSAGFGFRIVVPMLGPLPIALDFGFPIVKAASDVTQVFSFSMGFSR